MCVSTGNRWADLGIAVALGAVTGGVGTAAFGAGTAASVGVGAANLVGGSFLTAAGAGAFGGALLGGATSFLTSSMGQQQAEIAQQQQHIPEPKLDITGSGGRNAPAVLAEKIKAIKTQKQTPATPALQTATSPTDTGLQLSAA